MSATVNVLYPRTASGAEPTFDLAYYLSTHMPLVQKILEPAGLKKWETFKLSDDSSYQIQATLYFDSVSAWDEGIKSEEASKVFADIPNFTNTKPEIIKGEKVGSS